MPTSLLYRLPSVGAFQPSIQSPTTRPTLSSVAFPLPSSYRSSQTSRSSVFSSKIDVLSTKGTCAICLEEMKSGGGQAISAAHCSHSFQNRSSNHFPVCSATLKHTPLPCIHEKVQIKTSLAESQAVATSDSISSFKVLLEVHAPPLPDQTQRAPLDLVAVLDVSGSMYGPKLTLMQSAINFVIDHMLPSDRLSLVTLSTRAQTILPLREMNEEGRQDAKTVVNLLRAHEHQDADIVGGLNMGALVLERCGKPNAVGSIILLSNGVDTCDHPAYLDLLSPSISSSGSRDTNCESNDHNRLPRFPVHTFGIGENHDSVTMKAISDASGGVCSYIESAKSLPITFARCIGGLLSVVARDVQLVVTSPSPGVEIKFTPPRILEGEISLYVKEGLIWVGDLYADEKKEFLVNISIPEFSHTRQVKTEGRTSKTPLLDISGSYRCAFSNQFVHVKGERMEILRPSASLPAEYKDMLKNMHAALYQDNYIPLLLEPAAAGVVQREINGVVVDVLVSSRHRHLYRSNDEYKDMLKNMHAALYQDNYIHSLLEPAAAGVVQREINGIVVDLLVSLRHQHLYRSNDEYKDMLPGMPHMHASYANTV